MFDSSSKNKQKFSTLEKSNTENGNYGNDGNRSMLSFQTVLALAWEENGKGVKQHGYICNGILAYVGFAQYVCDLRTQVLVCSLTAYTAAMTCNESLPKKKKAVPRRSF